MTKLMKNTMIRTIAEMLEQTNDIDWIREEVSAMFDVEIDDKLWSLLHLQGAIRTHATPNSQAGKKPKDTNSCKRQAGKI